MLDETAGLEQRRARWRCNRGMLELDLLLIPFVENDFMTLSVLDKALFIELLTYEDPELFAWLMGHEEVTVEDLKSIVALIKSQKRSI